MTTGRSDPRQRIEAAATVLLAKDGYNGMGLKEISEIAHLPYGSIYHHFPGGKEQIAVASIEATGTLVAQLLTNLLRKGLTRSAVRSMFQLMADRLEESGWVDGCPVGTPALDGSATSAAVRTACDDAFERMLAPLVTTLSDAGRTRSSARRLAVTLVATYEGASMMARAQRSKAPLRAAAESMIELLDLTP